MYTNAQYTRDMSGNVNGISCNISEAFWFIPLDPANTDYANIMKLVEDNKLTIAPAEDKE